MAEHMSSILMHQVVFDN